MKTKSPYFLLKPQPVLLMIPLLLVIFMLEGRQILACVFPFIPTEREKTGKPRRGESMHMPCCSDVQPNF